MSGPEGLFDVLLVIVGERERREVQQLMLQMARLTQTLTVAANDVARDPDVVATMPVTLLFALDMDGPMRPTAVQELTGLSSGGVTKLVERLEHKGLVARKTGAIDGDRRGVLVELTRRGRNTVRSVSDAMAAAKKDADDLVGELSQTLG
jgi:hypothetical protein